MKKNITPKLGLQEENVAHVLMVTSPTIGRSRDFIPKVELIYHLKQRHDTITCLKLPLPLSLVWLLTHLKPDTAREETERRSIIYNLGSHHSCTTFDLAATGMT
jgi:hypothetical protein